ncbi:hypothetical protein ADIARSV_0639 [Arcticibacter svalbardensis MN12-7]|uniref:Putative auto-transporter adhesin head GIN domain-containing protein n=1 Tax=Arcticibacter svalbardensis MN12-7 TaxID=1150600 RepID=R9GWK1_9SPHI|nr:DUF2807 domain-containing protein [Arcticibacter svalbardensis]EOR96126.1 hypothetical protein ADIARSV_0639 [Arcticibacter svalbardensis MN12-7]
MKNLLRTLVVIAIISISFLANVFAANPEKTSIKKIIIKGNVKVFLIQRDKEAVVIKDTYDPNKTRVTTNGISLLINSDEKEPVTVVVYAKSPFRIDASNNSYVKTIGEFNLPYLQVFVNDNAKADINSITQSLYTRVNQLATLKISGISDEHFMVRSNNAKLKMDKLYCMKTSTTYFKPYQIDKSKLTAENLKDNR